MPRARGAAVTAVSRQRVPSQPSEMASFGPRHAQPGAARAPQPAGATHPESGGTPEHDEEAMERPLRACRSLSSQSALDITEMAAPSGANAAGRLVGNVGSIEGRGSEMRSYSRPTAAGTESAADSILGSGNPNAGGWPNCDNSNSTPSSSQDARPGSAAREHSKPVRVSTSRHSDADSWAAARTDGRSSVNQPAKRAQPDPAAVGSTVVTELAPSIAVTGHHGGRAPALAVAAAVAAVDSGSSNSLLPGAATATPPKEPSTAPAGSKSPPEASVANSTRSARVAVHRSPRPGSEGSAVGPSPPEGNVVVKSGARGCCAVM